MRNTHTDALAPWDRPCWTDGPVPLHDQFGLTAREARIGRWCFDGDGGDDDGGEANAPDYTGLEDVQGDVSAAEAAAAAAAEAEAAQDPDMGFDQDAIDDALSFSSAAGAAAAGISDDYDALSTDTRGMTAEEAEEAFDAVGDLSDYTSLDAAQAAVDIASADITGSVADMSGYETPAVEEAIDRLNDIAAVTVGYNDLAGFVDDRGFGLDFGPRDSTVSAIDEGFGPKTGDPDRVGTDFFDRKDEDIAKADAQIASTIETDAKGKGYDVNVGVDPDGTFSYTAGPGATFGDVAAVAGSEIAQGLMDLSPSYQVSQALGAPAIDFSLSPREGSDMAATAEYDPFATGYQEAYDRNMAMTQSAAQSALDDQIMADYELGLQQRMDEVPTSPDPYNNYVDAVIEAEEAIGGGGYYDQAYGSGDSVDYTDQGGDNPVVVEVVPEPPPPPAPPPPTYLSGYQPYVPAFGPNDQIRSMGLLAPSQLYGTAPRRQLVSNYINRYPTLDQVFSRQLG